MKPVYQTEFGEQRGNCLQACVASVLELPLENVPHFCLEENWVMALASFLSRFGLAPLIFDFDACQADDWKPTGFHLIGGKSPRGILHSVVGYNGEIVHDPHPASDGLRTIEDYLVFVATLDRRCPECGDERVMTTVVQGVCNVCGYAWDRT